MKRTQIDERSLMDYPDSKEVKVNECTNANNQTDDWKHGLSFLEDYGYNLDQLQPFSRISIQTDTSLTSIGGRSAPYCRYSSIVSFLGYPPSFLSTTASNLSSCSKVHRR